MAGSVPDLPGIQAPPEGAREIMVEVMRLLQRPTFKFPGAQPVSFSRENIQDLLREDFLVCEKSDGLRCLMLLSEFVDETGYSEERIYLITRQSEVSWVQNLHIPSDKSSSKPFQVGTLIDGELIKTNNGVTKFLMFDLLAHQRKILTDRSLDKRLGYLNELVFKPFALFCGQEPQAVNEFDFKIYMKPMSQSYRLEGVSKQERDHLSDGLIFTSVPAPYVFGTDPHILKWKPASENSIDFAIRLDFINGDDPNLETDYDSKPKVALLAWHGDHDAEFDELYLDDDTWETWKTYEDGLNYRIIEASKDEEGRWKFLRFRDDKDHGNHISIVKKVLESIFDSITLEDLASYTPEIKQRWEDRERSRRLKRPRPVD